MADESGLIRDRRYIVWDAEKASLNKLLLLPRKVKWTSQKYGTTISSRICLTLFLACTQISFKLVKRLWTSFPSLSNIICELILTSWLCYKNIGHCESSVTSNKKAVIVFEKTASELLRERLKLNYQVFCSVGSTSLLLSHKEESSQTEHPKGNSKVKWPFYSFSRLPHIQCCLTRRKVEVRGRPGDGSGSRGVLEPGSSHVRLYISIANTFSVYLRPSSNLRLLMSVRRFSLNCNYLTCIREVYIWNVCWG
jgi:hypothetical protein